jgi:hypothetical protein
MKLLALTLSIGLAIPVNAGGPVIIEDPEEGAPVALLSPGEKIALAAGLLLVGALRLLTSIPLCCCTLELPNSTYRVSWQGSLLTRTSAG